LLSHGVMLNPDATFVKAAESPLRSRGADC
jgi:hypothetical protein